MLILLASNLFPSCVLLFGLHCVVIINITAGGALAQDDDVVHDRDGIGKGVT